ncbi:hypothetical protein [Pseudomonas antarctica]|uniref:hypothetical protein n=1 Tax=Pseudomonas antarctica TaxID=219572 RepID=UPI003F754F6A
MKVLHLLFGKPTQNDWNCVKDVKLRNTWKVHRASISLDAAEVLASEGYQEAICQVRKMENDHSWAC